MNAFVQKMNNSVVRDGAYMPTLDGWRAIAITLVIFSHGSDSINNVLQYLGLSFDFSRIKDAGLLGVQIFFGLSGLLITSRLIADENRNGLISLKNFYIRRTFRILPASLVFLFVVGILALFGILPITLGRWLSSVFFFANYTPAAGSWYLGHFWSLAVEEHFYLVWPAIFLLLGPTNKRVGFAITLALILTFWRALDYKLQITGASPGYFWGRTDIQVDSIIWGVVIALLYGDPLWKSRLQKFLSLPAILPSLIVFMVVIAILPAPQWKLGFILLTLKAIITPLMILGTFINSSTLLSCTLETPIFRLIGRISYSLYLWQQLFLVSNAASVQSFGDLQRLPLNIVAVFACATLSFLIVEKHFIAFGHKLVAK